LSAAVSKPKVVLHLDTGRTGDGFGNPDTLDISTFDYLDVPLGIDTVNHADLEVVIRGHLR
jgi:hypothetical protein